MGTQFSKNLRRLMLKNGISSARELSRRVGVANTTIGDYLSGSSVPRKKTIEKLCEVLYCTEPELMGYSDGAASENEEMNLLFSLRVDTIFDYFGEKQIVVPDRIIKDYGNEGYTDYIETNSVNKSIPIGSYIYYISEDNPKAYSGHICAILHNSEIIYRRVFFTAYSVVLEPDTYTEGYESILYDIDSKDYEILGRVVWFEHMEEGL